jgi:glucokinase
VSEPVAIGVDVGGTKLVAATVTRDGRVLERRRKRTPAGRADLLVDTVDRLVADLGGTLPVGVGIAGLVDAGGVVRYGPNIGVRDLPLADELSQRLGREVTVGNDATTAAWGEYLVGAATAARDAVMLTLGTGVGGGVIVGGRLLEGAHGFGGELGHVIVQEAGRPCPCGNLGCLEAYASGTAIGLTARERLVNRDITSSLRDVDELDGKAVTSAALAGDDFAAEVLRDAGTWLGVGLASLVNVLDPELIVVGGGAAIQAGPFVIPAAVAAMRERVLGHDVRGLPDVVPATLSDDAGMIGAALRAVEAAA